MTSNVEHSCRFRPHYSADANLDLLNFDFDFFSCLSSIYPSWTYPSSSCSILSVSSTEGMEMPSNAADEGFVATKLDDREDWKDLLLA
jgi:hypothetical protein